MCCLRLIPSQTTPANENPIVAKWGSGSDSDDEWQLYIRTSTGRLEFHLNSSTNHASPDTVLISPYAPSFNMWHHVVALWDGNSGYAVLYLDDAIVDYTNSAITTMPNTSQQVTIGYGHFGSSSYGYFDGTLDQIKVYNYAIPAPGALILGSIGIGLLSWLRRRRTI